MFLALDASTKSTGAAIFKDSGEVVQYSCFTSASTDVVKRIQIMVSYIDELLSKFCVDTIVIEEVKPDQGDSNPKTMKALFWLQAAIIFLLHDKYPKVEVKYVYPSEWRQQCGIKTGRGIFRQELKQADIQFVKDTYGIDNINDDIADAICIGYAYLHPTFKEIKFGR